MAQYGREGRPRGDDEKGPPRRRPMFRRKVCRFCADKTLKIDYKDVRTMTQFVTERGKMTPSRITGNWEERTYNAAGTASGTASPGRISIVVSGSIRGSMVVNYSRSRQSVSISTSGSPLQRVSISLTRS